MATVSFEDFYEVPDLNFDIVRLKKDLDMILKNKKFKSPGVTILVQSQLIKSQMMKILLKVTMLEGNIGQLQTILEKRFQGMLI